MKAVIRVKRNVNDEPLDEITVNTERNRQGSVRDAIRRLNNLSLNELDSTELKTKLTFKRIDTSLYSTIDQWRESKFGDVSLKEVKTEIDQIHNLPLKPLSKKEIDSIQSVPMKYEYKSIPTTNIVKVNGSLLKREYTKILNPLEEEMDRSIWNCFQTGESDNIFIAIAYGADVNFMRPCDHTTALMALCYQHIYGSIITILDMDADLLIHDIYGNTAITIYESHPEEGNDKEKTLYIECLKELRRKERKQIRIRKEEEANSHDIDEEEYYNSIELTSGETTFSAINPEKETRQNLVEDVIEHDIDMKNEKVKSQLDYFDSNANYEVNPSSDTKTINSQNTEKPEYVYDIYTLIEGTHTQAKEISIEELYNKPDYQFWTSDDFKFEDDSNEEDEEISSNDENYEGNDYPDEETYHLDKDIHDYNEENEDNEDDDNNDLYYTNKIYKLHHQHVLSEMHCIHNHHNHENDSLDDDDSSLNEDEDPNNRDYDITGEYLYSDSDIEDNNDIRMASKIINQKNDLLNDYDNNNIEYSSCSTSDCYSDSDEAYYGLYDD